MLLAIAKAAASGCQRRSTPSRTRLVGFSRRRAVWDVAEIAVARRNGRAVDRWPLDVRLGASPRSRITADRITTRRSEKFYWSAVLATFALGMAAKDLTAIGLNLGFFSSIVLFGVVIAVPGCCGGAVD